jgi:predicted RNA binding protein YcfA (HicA-like mRNA interferase family)
LEQETSNKKIRIKILPLISLLKVGYMIRKVKEMIKIIEQDGWYLKAHKGTSHRQYTHHIKKGKVTINGKESDDLNHFLVNSILKQAGLK